MVKQHMKPVATGQDPLSLFSDELPPPPPKEPVLDPFGFSSKADHVPTPTTKKFTFPSFVSAVSGSLSTDRQPKHHDQEQATGSPIPSSSVGGLSGPSSYFNDKTLMNLKHKIQGTVHAFHGSASAALNELIKPLSHSSQLSSNVSREMSEVLDIDYFNYQKEVEFPDSFFTSLIERCPQFELMYSSPETVRRLLEPWVDESAPIFSVEGVLWFQERDFAGVTLSVTNMRLIFVPVEIKLDQAEYLDLLDHYFCKQGLAFVMRGHIVACSVERLVNKKKADDPSRTDALSLNTEVLLGACVTFKLMSGKTLKLIVKTNKNQVYNDLIEYLELRFQTFDETTFQLVKDPSNPSPNTELLFLEPKTIFAVFCSRDYYAGWGGVVNGNSHYELCDSYPPVLPMGGLEMTTENLREVAKFRSRGRLPVLSYRTCYSSLWRCSQPQTSMLGRRCDPDEWLVRSGLHQVSGSMSSGATIHIYDARPFANAFANKIAGAGYESTSQYVGCSVDFASIENIHRVSASYKGLKEVLNKYFDVSRVSGRLRHTNKLVCAKPASEIQAKIYQTGWFDHISALLRASYQIACLIDQRETVLVHCSDGWDRTAQLTFLSQVFLTPAARTIRGYCLLLEKEFSWLGHMLSNRLGLPISKNNSGPIMDDPRNNAHSSEAACPILLQLIECTLHILRQAPSEFSFNERFLLALANHIYTPIWGDFAFNSHKDRIEVRHSFTWRSFMKHVTQNTPVTWLNEESIPSNGGDRLIDFDPSPLHLTLWQRFWLRNCSLTL